MSCAGAGHTPIVFLAGAGGAESVWSSVRKHLGPSESTCAFTLRQPDASARSATDDRLTPAAAADALADAMARAGIEHCLIVAHSIGGLTARVFGRRYPERLVGAVLLDPTGLHFIDDNAVDRAEFVAAGWDPALSKLQASAVADWETHIPLIVLSHDPRLAVATGSESADDQRRWSEGQEEYGRLTPHGEQQDVLHATHHVQRDRPEVVAAAIQKVLRSLR